MLSFPLLQSSGLVVSTYLVSFLNWDLIQQQSQLNSNKITVIITIWKLFNNQFTHSVEYSSLNIWFLDLINTAFCCKWWSPHILKFLVHSKASKAQETHCNSPLPHLPADTWEFREHENHWGSLHLLSSTFVSQTRFVAMEADLICSTTQRQVIGDIVCLH